MMRLFGSHSRGDAGPTAGAAAVWAVEELLVLGAPMELTRGVLAAAAADDEDRVVMHPSIMSWIRLSEIKAGITASGRELEGKEALDKLREIRDVLYDEGKDDECIVDMETSAGFKMYVEQCERVIETEASVVALKGKKGQRISKTLPAKLRGELLPNVKLPPSSKLKARFRASSLTRDAFKKTLDALIADVRMPQTSLERVQEDLDAKVYAPTRPRLTAGTPHARAETPTKAMATMATRIAAPLAQSPAREWGDVGQRHQQEDVEDVQPTQVGDDVVSPTRRYLGTLAGYVKDFKDVVFRRKSSGANDVELTQPAQALGDTATQPQDEMFDDDDFAPQQTQYDDEEDDIMPTQVAPREPSPPQVVASKPSPPRPAKRTRAAVQEEDTLATDSDDEYATIAIPRSAQNIAQRPNVAVSPRPSVPVGPGYRKVRRRVHRWTEPEVAALLRGVNIFGAGSWARILQEYANIFEVAQRSQVDLKDKYRNILNARNRQQQR